MNSTIEQVMTDETPLHKLDVEPIRIHEETASNLKISSTLVPEEGREGTEIQYHAYKGKSMAVFTSGGDSSGMNSAVRSVRF